MGKAASTPQSKQLCKTSCDKIVTLDVQILLKFFVDAVFVYSYILEAV